MTSFTRQPGKRDEFVLCLYEDNFIVLTVVKNNLRLASLIKLRLGSPGQPACECLYGERFIARF